MRCMQILRKIVLSVLLLLMAGRGLVAGEREIFSRAEMFYASGDYYTAITEVMRYQSLYPTGPLFAKGMLLMARAYYKGNNMQRAADIFASCHRAYGDRHEGEEALYLAGLIQLIKGSPSDAAQLFDTYRALYQTGRFLEELERNSCFASALLLKANASLNTIRRYHELYPRGKYRSQIDHLEGTIRDDMNGPRRHVWVSVLGSIIIPGFGHFYTGNYMVGCITFITNALCGYLFYNAYRNRNTFQMVFFGAAGVIAYQYNIWSAVREAGEYNLRRKEDLFRRVRLGISASF